MVLPVHALPEWQKHGMRVPNPSRFRRQGEPGRQVFNQDLGVQGISSLGCCPASCYGPEHYGKTPHRCV
ncbi:hypothetical protein AmDm5_0259 [Acetobacter malorum]|nr:hypothetical protein AmDm5_0259 [Acetobacter malorum]